MPELETRCTCGARSFQKRDVVVTRSDGVLLAVSSMPHLTCIRCEREFFYDVESPGKVTLREIFHTVMADKEVMKKAVKEHRNEDWTEGQPRSFAAISEEDWKGYEEVRPE